MERIGRITKFLTKEPTLPIEVTGSFLAGNKRGFSSDSERFAAKFERTTILGQENIPVEPIPVIVACNHPNLYDLAAATSNITQAFFQIRRSERLPGKIRWMVAQNLVSKDPNPVAQKVIFPIINRALKIAHKTYDFIPVPINYLNPEEQKRERARVLISAREYLKNSPYSAIGIFPQGNFEKDNQSPEFYEGIGMLCRSMRTEVTVLPVGIYRNIKSKLVVNFGQVLHFSPGKSAEEITQSVKSAVETAKKGQ